MEEEAKKEEEIVVDGNNFICYAIETRERAYAIGDKISVIDPSPVSKARRKHVEIIQIIPIAEGKDGIETPANKAILFCEDGTIVTVFDVKITYNQIVPDFDNEEDNEEMEEYLKQSTNGMPIN